MSEIWIITKVKCRLGSIGNTEWWDEEDWKKHNKRVDELKASGEYMKEVEYDLELHHNEVFDGPIENYENNPNYKVIRK